MWGRKGGLGKIKGLIRVRCSLIRNNLEGGKKKQKRLEKDSLEKKSKCDNEQK